MAKNANVFAKKKCSCYSSFDKTGINICVHLSVRTRKTHKLEF